MRADRRQLLGVLRDPLSLPRLPGPGLDLVIRQLRRVKLLSRVAAELERAGVLEALPPGVRDQLASALRMARARARLARWELDRIAQALRPGGDHPVVVLKGSAYLLLEYEFAAGRLLSDVDLLVPEERIAEVEARLREAGWATAALGEYDERYYREWTHEIPPLRHEEREMEVDIHHNILQRTARLKPDSRLLLAQARPVPGTGYLVLAEPDMVLHAMTHLFYSGELDDALRDLADIDALLRRFSAATPQFWHSLRERAQALDLMRPAWYALRYCARLLATPVPAQVLADMAPGAPLAPARFLMDRLVPAALFARHPDRADRGAGLARTLLLVRSHWIRMPPLLLAAHLGRKAFWRMTARRVVP